jgi:hypothetical protein
MLVNLVHLGCLLASDLESCLSVATFFIESLSLRTMLEDGVLLAHLARLFVISAVTIPCSYLLL